jgi:hypothetical protein
VTHQWNRQASVDPGIDQCSLKCKHSKLPLSDNIIYTASTHLFFVVIICATHRVDKFLPIPDDKGPVDGVNVTLAETKGDWRRAIDFLHTDQSIFNFIVLTKHLILIELYDRLDSFSQHGHFSVLGQLHWPYTDTLFQQLRHLILMLRTWSCLVQHYIVSKGKQLCSNVSCAVTCNKYFQNWQFES